MKGRFRNYFDEGGPLDPLVPVTYQQHMDFMGVFADSLLAEASELSLDARSFSPSAYASSVYGVQAIAMIEDDS